MTYFFIDRADYKISGSDEKSDQINRFPFVFVFRLADGTRPYHIFPFDTGAALDGFFDERADPDIFLDDYELENTTRSVSGHINWVFQSRSRYYHAKVNEDAQTRLMPWQSVEKSYFDIAQMASPLHNRPDRRASAIEVAFRQSFQIQDSCEFMIMPKQLLEWGKNSNTQMVRQLQEAGVEWATYNWTSNSRPFEFYEEVSKKLEVFIDQHA